MKQLLILLGLVMSSSVFAEPAPVDFPFDWSQVDESRIDLSRFLDAPAGKAGPLKSEGESFVTGDGKEIRFWGVNLGGGASFPAKKDAAKIADDLARWGVNLVRFHHTDTKWNRSFIKKGGKTSQELDLENLDLFDNLFAELKKRGIWMVLTMNIHRTYREGDEVRDWEILSSGKGATYFNPRLIQLQHELTRKILTHKNPYTDLTYAEEPAIMGIELLNENSLVDSWIRWRLRPGKKKDQRYGIWRGLPESYTEELDGMYYDWLLEKGTPEQRAALTQETGISFDKRPEKIPTKIRLTPKDFEKAGKVRFYAETRFLAQIEEKFFDDYKKLIRDELGSKALLTLSNDHTDQNSGYTHLKTNFRGEWIDAHGYWDHPKIAKGTIIPNTPMVNVPLNSTVVQSGRSAVKGRPFTIGEVNNPFPHRYAVEGYPILAAYSMMQGWDGIAWFNWDKGSLDAKDAGIRKSGWFDLSKDPLKLAQLATCALMWHRGDVRESDEVHLRKYGEDEMHESIRRFDYQPYFKPGYDISMALKQKVQCTFDEEAQESPLGAEGTPRKISDRPPSIMDSETGELTWSHADIGSGLVRIDTAATCGLVGFLKEHWQKPEATTRHLIAEPENDYCSVILTSIDDQEITKSERLLLTATVRSSNTGQTWEDDFMTIAEWGTGPTRIVPFRGKVTLKNLETAQAVVAFPLSAEGVRQAEGEKVKKEGKDWVFTPEAVATWWEIEVKR